LLLSTLFFYTSDINNLIIIIFWIWGCLWCVDCLCRELW
jgi:hypothetical protein